LNWIAVDESQECEVRLYEDLFTEEFPTKYDGKFTDLVNPESLTVMRHARMHKRLNKGLKTLTKF
jgi:hypothetical protein